MAMSSAIKVNFLGDASDLARAAKKASGSVDEVGKKAGGLKSVLGGLSGAAVGAGLVKFAKDGIAGLKEQQDVSAQTTAVLKSMGGVSGQTQSHIENLADSIEKMSGLQAENVQAGENMLLTFGNIRGATFDRATRSMADLAARTGQDAVGAATMLGKALDNPTKGISALTRVGVSFSKAEQDQIKSMQAHGDMAGAQTIILKSLERQFGGSAKAAGQTMGGQLKILQARFGDVEEAVMVKVIPALLKVSETLGKVIGFVQRNQAVIVPLVGVLGTFAATIWTINKAAKAYTAVQEALNIVMDANPIGIVVVALAGLAVGMVVLWKKSETFRTIVTSAFKAVGGVVLTLVDAWLGGFQLIAEGMSHLPFIGDKFKGVADGIKGVRGKIHELKSDLDNLGKDTTRVPVVIDVTTTVGKGVQVAVSAKRDRLDARAAGGPVDAGTPYLVGEKGPEMFIPTRSGRINTNASLRAAGRGDVHLHINGPVYGDRQQLDALAERLARPLRNLDREAAAAGHR